MLYLKRTVFSIILLLGLSFPFVTYGNLTALSNATNFGPIQQQISGIVTDGITGEPIPFCNVALNGSTIGTATNELGEFVLNVDTFPANLVFSHLSYAQASLELSALKDVNVALEPLTTVLEEVVVSASKKDLEAIALVKKALKKTLKAPETSNFSRAFYRQKSKNGNSYSEFSEIFYDIKYNSKGINDWNIVEGRYALKDEEIFNRNFTVFSRILRPLQPNTNELIFPLREDFESFYQVNITEILQSEKRKIAQLRFKPLPQNVAPSFRGEIHIDMATYDIMKIKGTLSRDDLNLVKLTTKEGSWKDYQISYDINYKRDDLNQPLLDYIKVDQAFDYYQNDSLQYHSKTTSNLTFYEHYTATSKKRLGGRFKAGKSDWKKLDEVGYNELFWANNPIVKRTPIEEGVIASFEKNNAFSSIFLNSAENIAVQNSNISQNPFIKELGEKMNLYANYNPVEKVFLHTDKDLLATGETLWYSAYIILGANYEYSKASKVLHVDLISPENEVVHSQTHEVLDGRATGHLEISKKLATGNYQLRAYTQWMRNFKSDYFYSQKLQLYNPNKSAAALISNALKIDLQFFPEGGNLVHGILGKVAFKAIGPDGLHTKVKGRVLDSSGEQVALFSTLDRGAGFFQLSPDKNDHYTAVLEDGQKYKLPKVLSEGYTLSADNLNEKAVKITVQASSVLRNTSFFVVGHMNHRKYYQGKFDFGKNELLRFEIPKIKMPSGVLSITLFDEDKKPWSERAVFVNNQEELIIKTRVQTTKQSKRAKISLDVQITDPSGKPVSTDFSVAVTDSQQALREEGTSNILSHLLLQSDIQGYISKPGFLFKDQKRSTLNALDLVMLSHAWRKYNWPEIWNSAKDKKEYDFSNGLVLSGKAQHLSGKPLSNSMLRIVAKTNDYLSMFSTKTSQEGTFKISDFNYSGTSRLVFNALNSSEDAIDVKVSLDNNTFELPPSSFRNSNFVITKEGDEFSKFSEARTKMDSIYSTNKITNLEEVTVVADKKERPSETPSLYGVLPDLTIYPEDRGPLVDIFQLLRGFPGLQVTGAGFDTQVGIRNGGSPLWIVDGIPITIGNTVPVNIASVVGSGGDGGTDQPPPGITGSRGGTINSSGLAGENPDPAGRKATAPVPDFIKTIDVNTIEKIEVHKGASSGAISGLRAQSGVIVIYTQNLAKRVTAPGFDFLGHAFEKEFYSPKYDVANRKHETPDYRATLFWAPRLMTDVNGNARLEFFNSDSSNEIQVSIEALSKNGLPGTHLKRYPSKQ